MSKTWPPDVKRTLKQIKGSLFSVNFVLTDVGWQLFLVDIIVSRTVTTYTTTPLEELNRPIKKKHVLSTFRTIRKYL